VIDLKRLAIALAAFVGLGVVAWNTLSDQRMRAATLLVLGLFALKTWVRRKDTMHPEDLGADDRREQQGSTR
jgi:hypothetical protein